MSITKGEVAAWVARSEQGMSSSEVANQNLLREFGVVKENIYAAVADSRTNLKGGGNNIFWVSSREYPAGDVVIVSLTCSDPVMKIEVEVRVLSDYRVSFKSKTIPDRTYDLNALKNQGVAAAALRDMLVAAMSA